MKVGRFGLGFKSVFHMTGKVKYFLRKPKISFISYDSWSRKGKRK